MCVLGTKPSSSARPASTLNYGTMRVYGFDSRVLTVLHGLYVAAVP